MNGFLNQMKQRRVYRVAIGYAIAAWLAVQIAATVLPAFHAPEFILPVLIVLLGIGFPVALVLAWAFDVTPSGIQKTAEGTGPVAARNLRYGWALAGIGLLIATGGIGGYWLWHRPATARPVAPELGNVVAEKPAGGSGVAVSDKSIAVLPFLNMSGDKNDEYLSDGMTEELINVLAKLPGLRVPGRTSSFGFKGNNDANIFRKVGDQLHVSTVLEGSVRKAGDKLRITTQLIKVADGYHLWSETYDRDIKDILAVEGDVAQRVVEVLKLKLGVDEARALARKPTDNPEAHRLYLLGRYHTAKYTRSDLEQAVRYYEQALALDANYSLAYCGLADNYGLRGGISIPGREAWTKEKGLAQKALQLDPELAEAHLSLGIALASSYDWTDAEKELGAALELNPNLALAYDASAWVCVVQGRFDEASAKQKIALELDPLNPFLNDSLGWYLYWARRYDDAMKQLRDSIDLFPNDAFAHFTIGCCLLKEGHLPEARAELQKAAQLDDLPWYTGWVGYTYAASGNRVKAEQILHDFDELAKRRYVTPNARVPLYLGLGDKEKTLDGLEKCYQDQDGACWWLKVDQIYDPIRNEPRFQALLRNVGLDK